MSASGAITISTFLEGGCGEKRHCNMSAFRRALLGKDEPRTVEVGFRRARSAWRQAEPVCTAAIRVATETYAGTGYINQRFNKFAKLSLLRNGPHLDRNSSVSICEKADILNRQNLICKQINNVLCYFDDIDTVIKLMF